jgi:hypothetical protein
MTNPGVWRAHSCEPRSHSCERGLGGLQPCVGKSADVARKSARATKRS